LDKGIANGQGIGESNKKGMIIVALFYTTTMQALLQRGNPSLMLPKEYRKILGIKS
jgi:hypothetical protein